MSSYTVILLGSLPTEQIKPSTIGLYRDPPSHETVSHLQQRCNQRMLFILLFQVTQWNIACPVTLERFTCRLQRCNSWDCRLYCDHVV